MAALKIFTKPGPLEDFEDEHGVISKNMAQVYRNTLFPDNHPVRLIRRVSTGEIINPDVAAEAERIGLNFDMIGIGPKEECYAELPSISEIRNIYEKIEEKVGSLPLTHCRLAVQALLIDLKSEIGRLSSAAT